MFRPDPDRTKSPRIVQDPMLDTCVNENGDRRVLCKVLFVLAFSVASRSQRSDLQELRRPNGKSEIYHQTLSVAVFFGVSEVQKAANQHNTNQRLLPEM